MPHKTSIEYFPARLCTAASGGALRAVKFLTRRPADWAVHVVSDGLLITGQNPASSGPAAETLMASIKQKAGPAGTARAARKKEGVEVFLLDAVEANGLVELSLRSRVNS